MTSSLEQLQAALLKEVTVKIQGQDIVFKLAIPDPAEFFRDLEIGNPILEALQEGMRVASEQVDKNGKMTFKVGGLVGQLSPLITKAVNDSTTYNSLLNGINRVLGEAIVEPKLPADGILSIKNIPIDAKFAMISEMYGGQPLIEWLSIFREGQAPIVFTRTKSEKVQQVARGDDAD